ncbi:hypothetical protein KJ765_05330 [Candidatus Micrarchaeota archaeon]|nr:hypothetical protein [Candidatus Micrarchaeota archaeon]
MRTYALVAAALLAAIGMLFQFANSIIGIPTGFGMTIDLVAVPVLLAFFVLGYEVALYVLVLLALLITFASPTSFVGAIMKFSATLPMFFIPTLYLMARKRGFDAVKLFGILVLAVILLGVLFALGGYSYAFSETLFENALLIGVLPFLVLVAFSYFLLHIWKRYGADLTLSSLASWKSALFVLALALLLRGILMIFTNFYFAGPLFFKISPQEFTSFVESVPLPFLGSNSWYFVVFFWNALQGAMEFTIAWLIAFRFGFARKYGA